MRPSRSAQALRAIVRDLIATPDGATYFAERFWGMSLRYDLVGDHPLVGRSAPDFELAETKTPHEWIAPRMASVLFSRHRSEIPPFGKGTRKLSARFRVGRAP
jgi:hypothetical protein